MNSFFEISLVYLWGMLVGFITIFLPSIPGLFNSLLFNFFSVKTVIVISQMSAFWSSLARILIFKREIIKKDLNKIIFWGIVGSLLGGFFIGIIPDIVLVYIIFGFVLKAFIDNLKRKEGMKKEDIVHTKYDIFVSGFVANFLTTLGAPAGIRKNFYLAKGYNMQETLGTISVLFLIASFFSLIPRVYFGDLTLDLFLKLAPIFFTSLFVAFVGRKILIKISDTMQKRYVFWLLLFSLIIMLPKVLMIY